MDVFRPIPVDVMMINEKSVVDLFVKHDNRPENLEVMTEESHLKLHREIINGAKWSDQNSDWIQQFKANHSKFMSENNPAERKDITFGRILEIAERTGFNSKRMCEVLDTANRLAFTACVLFLDVAGVERDDLTKIAEQYLDSAIDC